MSMHDSISEGPKAARTMAELVRAAAAAYGDDTAIVLREESLPDETLSFNELERKSAELARGLIARGVGKGTRIGFICGNTPAFALLLAAISRIGAVAIPISTMIRSNELVRVLRQSDVTGLIVQRNFLGNDYVERVCEALPQLRQTANPDLRIGQTPFLRWIVSTGDDLPASINDMAFLTDAAESVSEDLLREVESEVYPTDQLIEIYTSGSMALPKGVRHNHGPMLFRTHYLDQMIGFERGKEVAVHLPMFWVGGLMMYLMPSWAAGSISVCTGRTLNNSRVAMGSVLAAEDIALVAMNKPYWGLGMSETIGPYSWGDEVRADGRPMCAPMDHFGDRYDIRIADENDQPVGNGGIGEMQVRGYPVTPGLHKVERDVYFTSDGYYRTGDMCEVEGKRIHFVGRNGDMIKTAGSNVSPAEVELELQSLDGVHNAYVVGLPDKERGQLVVAALIPRDGAALDCNAIEAEMRKRLSSYKVPRAYVAIEREELPMLHSNKVSRRLLEALMAEKLGRVAA